MTGKRFTGLAYVTCLAVILALLLLLGGCSGSTKSESDIIADIQTQDNFFSEYGLNVDDYSITKRQTNQNNKTDYVWARVDASNDDFTYYGEYVLTYGLYNDGWVLDNCNQDVRSYSGKHSENVQQEAVDQVMEYEGYDEWSLIDRQASDNYIEFTCTASRSEYYLKTEYYLTVSFRFTPDALWSDYEIEINDRESYPDTDEIIGEWFYQDDMRNFYINIVDMDFDLGTIYFEYALENVNISRTGIFNPRYATLSSNGISKSNLNEGTHENAYYFDIYYSDEGRFNVWIYVGYDNRYDGEGVTINECSLEKR